jgi:hypothetical protein
MTNLPIPRWRSAICHSVPAAAGSFPLRSQGASSSSSSSSSNPATRSDGVLECGSTAPSPNCTRVAGWSCGKRNGSLTNLVARQLQARQSSDSAAYRSRTRRDIATTRECRGSFCGQDTQPLWYSCIRFLSSSHCLWSTRFQQSGHIYRNQVSRKEKETGEGYQNSHFQLQPDVRSQPRCRDRRGEEQCFSWGAASERTIAQPGHQRSFKIEIGSE